MARTRISEFSATAADNTDIDNIDIAEGCAPSGINNAIRELMAQLKDFQTGAGGDPFNGAVNGTLGATTPAAATITNLSYTGTLTGGTGVVNIGSGQVYKDASGNVGIGVTPSAWSGVDGVLEIKGNAYISSTSQVLSLNTNCFFNGTNWIYKSTSNASRYETVFGENRWFTAPSGTAGNAISFTQAMTLDSSGNLLVGTTTAGTANNNGFTVNPSGSYAGNLYVNHNNAATNGTGYIAFGYNGTSIGSIAQNGTTGTSYNTTSDYRLKENVAPMQNALATVAALKPCTYTWKADGSAGQGFIAHELQAVVPDCVTGEKDAVETVDDLDADGNKIGTKEVPRYQGVDTSFLVATLVAAIQEQQALIQDLTTRLEALEA